MFTGIITHRGIIISRTSTFLIFSIPSNRSNSSNPSPKLKKGSSIAVNGVCLTITDSQENTFHVDVMDETWKKTALETLDKDSLVNLELPMQIGSRFEGHIVQGHVDGVAHVISIKKEGNSRFITFKSDKKLTRFMVPKGSVAVDGISLTLISVKDVTFSVGIIPYTLSHTNMAHVKVGTYCNIEVDIIAKYIEKLLRARSR